MDIDDIDAALELQEKNIHGPLHHKAGTKRASWDLEGCWKHPATESGCEEYFVFNCVPSGNKFVD
eukprot:1147595-Pelagomonas_calceolata.AAC.15